MLAQNTSGYENRLKLPKLAENFKDCDFLCVGENTERYIFLA